MVNDALENNENTNTDFGIKEETRPLPYAHEPLYKELTLNYQNAEWETCKRIIDQLLGQYPEDDYLLEFKEEVDVRERLQKIGQESEKEERQEKLKKNLIRILIGVGILIVIGLGVFWGYNQYNNGIQQARLEREQAALLQTLENKYQNAENYMQAGRASEALSLYQEIYDIDPTYLDVEEKIQEVETLLGVESDYQEALALYNQGDHNAALELFYLIEDKHPQYKSTRSLIQNIEGEKEIQRLFQVADQAYQDQNWLEVVNAAESILEINSSQDISQIEEELFISYMNLIIETADKTDATIEDVDQAESYYRAALALFPQNKEYAGEREELQRIAINLLANKYYIYAIELIESEDYSIQSMEEALRILNRANNIGSGSPAIELEIDRATQYISAYNSFVGTNWEEAINGLENLYRLDANYADGMVVYLLYESYLARGDTFYAFADYASARQDYETAETFARQSSDNTLRVFQIQVRMGNTLRRLSSPQDSAAFYNYAIELINFENKISNNPDLEDTLDEAQYAYATNDYWNAARLYEICLEDYGFIYSLQTLEVERGDSLAQIAYRYGTSIDALQAFNNLGDSLLIRSSQELTIPYLPEDRQ